MNAGWAFVAGSVLGAVLITMVSLAVNRRLAAERDGWRVKTGVLVGAIRPFASVRVQKVTARVLGVRSHRGWFYWSCSSWGCASNPGIIGGPPSDVATLARTNDEAREHYLDEHMTRENIARVDRALCDVLGLNWRRDR